MKPQSNRRTAALYIVAAASLCGLANTHAATCALVPSGRAHIEEVQRASLLGEMKFAELEKDLAKLHKKNMAAEGGDLLTMRDMQNLQRLSGQEEKLVRMWAQERPESFFAQLNAAAFYVDQAFFARGPKASTGVSRNQWSNARKIREVAVGYAKKAMALDARSALPQAALIGLAAIDGKADGRTPGEWLQSANEVDPINMAARVMATTYLSPRWGGSFEQLDQMATQAARTLPAATAHYLRYNVVMAKASHYEVMEKDNTKAQGLYKQARDMCENSETAREGFVRTYR
ncbi:MAG: DUF4034 domain-containing protein [Burkholderiales bacterium]|nr:DUF4034 domain-containing protein [Burkholderiales bacterium]